MDDLITRNKRAHSYRKEVRKQRKQDRELHKFRIAWTCIILFCLVCWALVLGVLL